MGDPVIIEVAVCSPSKQYAPLLPEEVAAAAIACIDAGAAIVHSHIEDFSMSGEAGAERYAEAYRAVKAARPEAILYPTVSMPDDGGSRFGHLPPLVREGLIEMCAFDPGSTNLCGNLGPDGLPTREFVYVNSIGDVRRAFETCSELGIGPALAIYEPSFLRATLAFHRAGKLPAGTMTKLYFGGERSYLDGTVSDWTFGLPPTVKALEAYLEMLEGSGLLWATAILGGDLVASGMARWTLERGGHLRVGLEDYAGERTPSNHELVAEAANLVRSMGKRPATPDETRDMLGLRARSMAA